MQSLLCKPGTAPIVLSGSNCRQEPSIIALQCQHSRVLHVSTTSTVSCASCSVSSTPSTSNLDGTISGRLRDTRRSRRLSFRHMVAAAADSPAAAGQEQEVIKLSSLQSSPIINEQGLINPSVPGGEDHVFKAFVFAIYDPQMKIQYTGFSADLRNTLRTMVGRRPDKAHYYKVVGLPELNQERMLQIRNAWFEQLGGPPIGNKLTLERNMWQKPVDAGAISARGKRGAAEEQCRQLQDQR
ncbi:hypothetical protein DUNSADRAFT_11914, partial [Dunaliella salina]